MSGPEILTGRSRLSSLLAADASAFFEYRSDPEVGRHQSFVPDSFDDAEEFIDGLQRVAFDTPGSWFEYRVFASVDRRNQPAIALLKRVGMRQEAQFRESLWFKGERVGDMVFGILASEWSVR